MGDTKKLRKALQEILENISGTVDGEDIKVLAKEALDSGDTAKMQEAIDRFDRLSTICIQKMRKDR